MSQDRLTGLLGWYKEEGLVPKENISGGRRNNTRAHSIEDLKRTLNFVTKYAEHHALVLPGRVPGSKRDDVKLLPSSETKAKVYGVYSATMKDSGMNAKWFWFTIICIRCKIKRIVLYCIVFYCIVQNVG